MKKICLYLLVVLVVLSLTMAGVSCKKTTGTLNGENWCLSYIDNSL